MPHCEPLGILVWLLVFAVGDYFLFRCVRTGEIFSGNVPVSFNPISFFAKRTDSPIAFWTQFTLYFLILVVVLALIYPSARACVT
jgi:hypothetical protein